MKETKIITIYNELDARQLMDPELQRLVRKHLDLAKKNGLEDLTVIAVIEPVDSDCCRAWLFTLAKSVDREADRRSRLHTRLGLDGN
ncbi:hypothetical protein [Aurantiacibacter luteus]|uniref:Uncharacterized protein n=1 Tax=Aurantiacibacter luteus TaxID=1581420 RepID=A0A0G9MNN6_9SPHN|nr:hypothetical protein [Aurantiacibacter luteus]KLE32332.1 hypothetical protein AAW00_12780 [Aurantiacibacter luteus]